MVNLFLPAALPTPGNAGFYVGKLQVLSNGTVSDASESAAGVAKEKAGD
jgi:hypothetical protein